MLVRFGEVTDRPDEGEHEQAGPQDLKRGYEREKNILLELFHTWIFGRWMNDKVEEEIERQVRERIRTRDRELERRNNDERRILIPFWIIVGVLVLYQIFRSPR